MTALGASGLVDLQKLLSWIGRRFPYYTAMVFYLIVIFICVLGF